MVSVGEILGIKVFDTGGECHDDYLNDTKNCAFNEGIEFKNVSFKYSKDGEYAVENISFYLKMALAEVSESADVNRAALLAEILLYLEKYSEIYLTHGFERIKPLWEEASCTIGNQVRATTLREVIVGKALAITDSGVLQIQRADGTVAEVYSADVELV